MNNVLKIVEIEDFPIKAEYVNAFRCHTAPNEFVLELAFVDIASSVKAAERAERPLEKLEARLRGKYVIRPDQIPMLIDTLQKSYETHLENNKK